MKTLRCAKIITVVVFALLANNGCLKAQDKYRFELTIMEAVCNFFTLKIEI
jgi:hypothetical protein